MERGAPPALGVAAGFPMRYIPFVNEQTRLARDHISPFTADDFLRMMELGAFADMRAELVRGGIEKMMPAEWTHGELNARLVGLLYPIARAAGARIGSDVAIKIGETTVRAFDVAVVRPEALPAQLLAGSEILLAIEIAETTHRRDLGEKREEYGSVGIPAYWVVDAVKQVTHCFALDCSGVAYSPASIIPFSRPLMVPGLSGSITLD
jgi:Uma2 family endonuclease